MQGKTTVAIFVFLIVAAVAFLILTSTGDTAHYFLTVDELRAMGGEAADRSVTVSGVVLGDTIVYDPSISLLTFSIAQVPADPKEVKWAGGLARVLRAAAVDPGAPRLEVVYTGTRPDRLQHEAQAIVRGHLGSDGRFYADEILLKCPSRYEEEIPDQAGGG